MLLILTSSYSGLLSLAAHCSKKLKKKNCLIKHVCPFSTFPLTRSTFFAFSRLFAYCFPSKNFFFLGSLFSYAYAFASFLFFILFYFIFYFLCSPSTQATASLSSTHATKLICSSLLPLTKPTITNTPLLFFL